MQVVRNHLFWLSRQQSDGRHAMPHPKLDDRVRLSSQFPQLVTVFESQIGQRFHSGLATAAGSCFWWVAHRICHERVELLGRQSAIGIDRRLRILPSTLRR